MTLTLMLTVVMAGVTAAGMIALILTEGLTTAERIALYQTVAGLALVGFGLHEVIRACRGLDQ